jgi:uncharacterized protein (DUF58 family)
MAFLTPKTISEAYLILIFLAAILSSAPPYSIVTLGLLALWLYSFYKPPGAELTLTLTVATLILTPLALQSLAGPFFSAFLIIPIIPLLDQSLRMNALNQSITHSKAGRKATTTLKALATTLSIIFVSSIILLNYMLLLTSIILIMYLASVLLYIFRTIPKMPLEESRTWRRVLVGDTAEVPLSLKSKAKTPLQVYLKAPQQWMHLQPSALEMDTHAEAKFNLTFTPPLAGPSKLQLHALTVDPWGLTQTNQTLEPVELHIIPKARYAEWLAKKYLEQPASGTAPIVTTSPLKTLKTARRGVEYSSSRLYQPGDRLKDVDWKHTFKLQQLVIKEYLSAQGQSAIIATNLNAKDPEEADELAYNLITSALTLATEGLPTALAAYNQKDIIETTTAINPLETLKKALKLTQNITLVEPLQRTLDPPDIKRLRRNISELEKAPTKPAEKLAEILKLEYQILQETAKEHPAGRALTKAAEGTPAPAVITVVSPLSHDTDALAVTLEKLERKGYSTVVVKSKTKPPKSASQTR